MTKKLLRISIFFFASIVFLSCQKQEFIKEKDLTTKEENIIKYDENHDLLIFSSSENLREYIDLINTGTQISSIDKRFVSLLSILNKVIESEDELENQYEKLYKDKKLSESDLKKITTELDSKPIEKETAKLLKEGLIKTFNGSNSIHYELTTCAPYYASVLNKKSIVMVGDTIIQFSANQIKKITDGDFNKISLLKNTIETNLENNIEVINVKSIDSNTKSQIMFYDKYQIQAYDKKLIVTAFLNENNAYYSTEKSYVYCLKFYCERKNWLGRWKSDTNALVIITDFLQVIKNGTSVLNHKNGICVYNANGYSGSILVYEDGYSTDERKFSSNNVKWNRSGGPHDFFKYIEAVSYNWE